MVFWTVGSIVLIVTPVRVLEKYWKMTEKQMLYSLTEKFKFANSERMLSSLCSWEGLASTQKKRQDKEVSFCMYVHTAL